MSATQLSSLPAEIQLQILSRIEERNPSLCRTSRLFHALYTNPNTREQMLTPLWERCHNDPALAYLFSPAIHEELQRRSAVILNTGADQVILPSVGLEYIIRSEKEELARMKGGKAFFRTLTRTHKADSLTAIRATEQFLKDKNLLLFASRIQRQLPGLPPIDLRSTSTFHAQANAIRAWLNGNPAAVQNVTNLHVSDANLTQIPEELSLFTSLQVLNLSHNSIKNIDASAFQTLGNLQVLGLHNNQIQVLPPNVFQTLGNLRWLDLSHNQIQVLPPNVFQALGNLQDLYVIDKTLSDIFDK